MESDKGLWIPWNLSEQYFVEQAYMITHFSFVI